uniref:Chemokine interleukin-8-like domain-containing protein n=1 Tax=Sparus aurata TaxID=8175 RepID=A0A671YX21_SPAAU
KEGQSQGVILKMRVSLVFATLLCFMAWESCVHATHMPVVNCCPMRSKTMIPLTRIANYTVQVEGVCPIAAIRFRTNTGGTICSDQNGDCAKEDVLKVDEEDRKNTLQENGQNDEEATSDITPATVTTSTHTTEQQATSHQQRPPHQNCTSQKRRKSNGRTGQRHFV